MIDQFVEDAKKEIGDELMQEFELDQSSLTNLFRIVKTALQDQVKLYFFKGKISEIVSLFTNDVSTDNIQNETIEKIKKALVLQMNYSETKSETLSVAIVPLVISFFRKKFETSGKSKDITGVSEFLGLGGIANIFSIFNPKN